MDSGEIRALYSTVAIGLTYPKIGSKLATSDRPVSQPLGLHPEDHLWPSDKARTLQIIKAT